LHDFAANQIWLELVALAADLLAWTQHLALADTPAEPGSPNGCDCGCSTSPAAPSEPAAAICCDYPAAGPGPITCCTDSTGSTR
jgi:hypothetical protein